MTTESHSCLLDRQYPNGIMGCGCGRLWLTPSRDMIRFAFVNTDLLRRLRDHQAAIRHHDVPGMAAAVGAAAIRARADRDAAREKLRESWPRVQAAKRSKWWRTVRAIVLTRPCAYCGGIAAEVDHVIPLALGGTHRMRNFAAACSRCNAEKGKRTPAEWKAWRERRGRCWPPLPAAA